MASSPKYVEIRIVAQGTTSQSGASDTKAQQDTELTPGSVPTPGAGSGGGGTTAPTPSTGGGGDGGGSGITPNPSSGGGVDINFEGSFSRTDTTDDLSKGYKALAIQAGKQLANMAISQAKYEINRTTSLTGDYQLANTVTNVSNGLSAGVSIGTSMATGFAMAGPVGGFVMGALAVGGYALQTWNSQRSEEDTIRSNEWSANYNRVRAGYSLTAGTSGEDR